MGKTVATCFTLLGLVCVLAAQPGRAQAPPVPPEPTWFDEAPTDPSVFGAAGRRVYVPSVGTVNALLVFTQFKDGTAGESIPEFAGRLFDPDYPGSFTHFYDAMSFGRLRVKGTVLPRRYSSAQPASAYLSTRPDEKGRFADYVDEILAQVDEEYDLGAFDNNGPDGEPNSGDDDRRVDYVFVLLPHVPRNFILGGADGIAGLATKYRSTRAKTPAGKGIYVSGLSYHGTIMREGSFSRTVGIMAHEFGHSMGLPDLYDLSFRDDPDQDPSEDSAGTGCWGLMGRGRALGCQGGGPSPFSAWSRERLGWVGPDNDRLDGVDSPRTGLRVADLYEGGSMIRMRLGDDADLEEDEQEYLLLEQREQTTNHYNQQMPAGGLLIWHIRPLAGDNDREEYQMVELICADGLYADAGFPDGRRPDPVRGGDNLDFWAKDGPYRTSHGGNHGDAGDPFDGVEYRHYDPTSNPSTEGTGTDLAIRIDRQGSESVLAVSWGGAVEPLDEAMTVDVATAVLEDEWREEEETDRVELLPNYPNPFPFQTRIPYTLDRTAEVRLQIYNSLGQTVRYLVDEDQDQGRQEVLWDGRDERGQTVASGVYLSRLEVGRDFAASRPMLRLPGYAQLIRLEDLEQETGAVVGDQLGNTAAATYGIAEQPSPERGAFTGGAEWTTLKMRWRYGAAGAALQAERANLARALALLADSAAVGRALGRLDAATLHATEEDRAQAGSVEAALMALAQSHSEQAGLYFFLGAWTQRLRAAILGAQRQGDPSGIDGPANAEAGRHLAAYLESLDGDPVLVQALGDLAARLQAGVENPLELDALAERLEELAAPLRLW